jgi:hypothetical protein
MKANQHNILFFLIFVLLFIGRWMLSGTGYLDDPDEYVYHLMLLHLDELYNFEAYYWCKATFNIHFFPVEVLIRLIETKFTILYANYKNLPLDHIDVLIVPGFFNILFSLANLFIIYKILLSLGFEKQLALLGILIYGGFSCTNIYTRHILPYENSYFFHLIALYLLVKDVPNNKRILLAGLFFTLGHATYFGFFMMLFVLGLYLSLQVYSQGFKKLVFKQFLLIVPLIIYIVGFDILSRIYFHDSYIEYTLRFSKTIYQGSYDEALIYAFLYLFKVESWWGLSFILAFLLGAGLLFFQKNHKNLKLFIFVFLMAYVLFGLNALLFEGMVLYGRVFRMYYLPILTGALFLLSYLPKKQLTISYAIIAILSLGNYYRVVNDLNQLAYPRCEIQKNGFISHEQTGVNINYQDVLTCALEYQANSRFVGIQETQLAPGSYTFQNACFFLS